MYKNEKFTYQLIAKTYKSVDQYVSKKLQPSQNNTNFSVTGNNRENERHGQKNQLTEKTTTLPKFEKTSNILPQILQEHPILQKKSKKCKFCNNLAKTQDLTILHN